MLLSVLKSWMNGLSVGSIWVSQVFAAGSWLKYWRYWSNGQYKKGTIPDYAWERSQDDSLRYHVRDGKTWLACGGPGTRPLSMLDPHWRMPSKSSLAKTPRIQASLFTLKYKLLPPLSHHNTSNSGTGSKSSLLKQGDALNPIMSPYLSMLGWAFLPGVR